MWSGEGGVEEGGDGCAVHVAAYDDEFHHAVAHFGVPVAHHVGVGGEERFAVFLRGGGEPESGLGEIFLPSGLLEEIAHGGVFGEIADAFGADDRGGPVFVADPVEAVEREGPAGVIYKGADAVFLGFPFVVVVMVCISGRQL